MDNQFTIIHLNGKYYVYTVTHINEDVYVNIEKINEVSDANNKIIHSMG